MAIELGKENQKNLLSGGGSVYTILTEGLMRVRWRVARVTAV